MSSKVHQYPLFQLWYQTVDWMMDRSGKFPRQVRHSLVHRIDGHGLEVLDLISEAIFTPPKPRRRVLRQINLRLDQLRILWRLAHDRRYISTQQYAYISKQIDEAGRMTGGWLRSL